MADTYHYRCPECGCTVDVDSSRVHKVLAPDGNAFCLVCKAPIAIKTFVVKTKEEAKQAAAPKPEPKPEPEPQNEPALETEPDRESSFPFRKKPKEK